jgi:hypothetical protein
MRLTKEQIGNIAARADRFYNNRPERGGYAAPSVDELMSYMTNEDRLALMHAIASLDDDARAELHAVMWIGRGDYAAADWDAAVAHGHETQDDGMTDASYIGSKKQVADYLRKGVEALERAGKI